MSTYTTDDTLDRIRSLTDLQREALYDIAGVSDAKMELAYQQELRCFHGDDVKIAGYTYDVVSTLKAVDPTAYRCGLADYIGTDESIVEHHSLYYRIDKAGAWLDAFEEDAT